MLKKKRIFICNRLHKHLNRTAIKSKRSHAFHREAWLFRIRYTKNPFNPINPLLKKYRWLR